MEHEAYSDAKLIELVKRQPAIWCKDDPLYNNRIADKTIWSEISDLLEMDVHILKKKWHTLRGQYRREIRLYSRRSKWKHFKRLSFLEQSLLPKGLPAVVMKNEAVHDYEGDPISIEPSQLDTPSEHNVPLKEESFDWSCSSTVSPRVEKNCESPRVEPKVPVVDVSNESNYYFALSLIGILNSIPKKNELAARIAILNALKDFQPAHTENMH
ncbi:uncharacterized protein LOC125774724 [Anopheles funestus]|uniref:MADF domain-containing protein n=1 Tax=Anopheles funestus TaxID=62324 RepID=A0A182RSZ1_ANOFN|nr:uncharacterized protein LOC125774724 [Anopheles funestus]